MNNNLLGEQIARFRKAIGMTQEDLGRAVGISAQAVSRWECGGAPDVTLLPAVADTLGVTVDALFGREAVEKTDIEDTVRRWMLTVPHGQRVDRLCRMVWSAAGPAASRSGRPEDSPEFRTYENCCRSKPIVWEDRTYQMLRQTNIMLDDGYILGIRANDMSYAAIFPEPEAGWEAFLDSNDSYRQLFALLAKPHCLELLEYLHSRYVHFGRSFTAGALSKQTGFDVAEVESLLDALTELSILMVTEMETENGVQSAFCLAENEGLLPLLCFATWTMSLGNRTSFNGRSTPILRGEKWKEKGAST